LLHRDIALDFTMVHAGIPPQWTLRQAIQHADEISRALRGPQCDEFLASMYGNQPANWHDDFAGTKRLRSITNYFTRMRFCRADGELDFDHKDGTEALSEQMGTTGFAPWFLHPERKTRDDRIIFGHWAALEGRAENENVFALDTGCVWGGAMTMMRLEDRQLFRCEC
jgi:bis(5'-nucleosyl)-tetraphosphatase (symmetrical)